MSPSRATTRPPVPTSSTSTTRSAAPSSASTRRSTSASRAAGFAYDAPSAREEPMRDETIAIHSGYEVDPATKAVAVPIDQIVVYASDSGDHGAALCNREAEGYRVGRIRNPHTAE